MRIKSDVNYDEPEPKVADGRKPANAFVNDDW